MKNGHFSTEDFEKVFLSAPRCIFFPPPIFFLPRVDDEEVIHIANLKCHWFSLLATFSLAALTSTFSWKLRPNDNCCESALQAAASSSLLLRDGIQFSSIHFYLFEKDRDI